MNPPPATSPASERRNSAATEAAAPDASKERGDPASGAAIAGTTPEEAPVTDSTENAESGAQGGLHDTTVSNSENNSEIATSTRRDSPSKSCSSYLEAYLDDRIAQNTSKQVANSDGTRKRNFQHGNKEVQVSATGSSSHAPEISVVETKDARSKFQKKSNNEEPFGEEAKDTGSAGISEVLKESENRSSLNSSCLKDEKEQKNGSRGKENNRSVCNTSTSQDLPLPTGTGNSCLTKIVTEDDKEAPKCMDLRVKQNPNEVTPDSSFVVANAKTTAGKTVNADGIIQKKYDEVLHSSFEEKETENVATFLGCLDSTTGEFFYQNANVKTDCLDPTTGEYFYQRKKIIKPSDVVSRHNSSEERQNLGFVKHTREAIPHTLLNRAVKDNVLPSENQKNQSYPFSEGANFFPMGMVHPNFRAGVHHSMDICGPGAMAGYGFGRNYFDHTSTERNRMQEKELACLPTYHNINRTSPSYPFNERANFFQVGMADPNFRAGIDHSMDIYGSGAMADRNFRAGVHHSMDIYGSGAMADPNFRAGVHHSMDIYGSGTIADRNFRAGVHHSMDIYGSGAMPDPNFRAGVHHSLDIYRSGARTEYGFGRSYWDHTSTERNETQEKELAYSSTYHNINRISPSSLPHAYSEDLRFAFSPRHSLVGVRKKKLLILDLNGLLADINEDIHNAHMADAKVRGKLVFRRPYCDDFLNFCIRNFELGIWSSRKRKNVDSVFDILMRDLKPYLLFSWDRSKCTITGHKTLENMHKPIVLKELRKLWNKEEPGLPWVEGEFSPSNTLLVDDSPYKALRNPPYSAIFPLPFSYLNRKDDSLGPGGDLRVYLENLVFADDVESFVRNHPFGQPFITPSDPHWNYYAEIAGEGYGAVTCRV